MTQQNTQAVVLQQPTDQMVHLDLQHSTDTTAIWSFVIAMVVAFILGISATIIVIWYGRKSFKLTEMSFRTVSNDIKEAAILNRQVNADIIEAQYKLKNLGYKKKFMQNWVSGFANEVASLDCEVFEILNELRVYCSKSFKGCDIDTIKAIRLGIGAINKRIFKIRLDLKTNLLMKEDIDSDLKQFYSQLTDISSNWTREQNMTNEQWVDLIKLNLQIQIQKKLEIVITHSISEIKAA
ncbi:hypothetical protein [Acinetobacter faecalis]|uniref:hypothetical protein n=1 Tax=Acinetobacter faecalis TaxID=2665161 RepID=UPI002A91184D|nr:hypothetical protein [Acinetobacter faecalis]MDY6529342.1 hypothetical protein [Acinetobacter faecalis]